MRLFNFPRTAFLIVRKSSNSVPGYIDITSETSYFKMQHLFQAAKICIKQGEILPGKQCIESAIQESYKVHGEAPAIISIRQGMMEFRDSISESSKGKSGLVSVSKL